MHKKRSIAKERTCDVVEHLPEILEELSHYHVAHTSDQISRFTNTIAPGPDELKEVAIYITTNPVWIEKLAELTKDLFPPELKEVLPNQPPNPKTLN